MTKHIPRFIFCLIFSSIIVVLMLSEIGFDTYSLFEVFKVWSALAVILYAFVYGVLFGT